MARPNGNAAPGPFSWPDEVRRELRRRNRAGRSWRGIAEDLGGTWSHATLNRIARNGQAPPRPLAQALGISAPPACYVVQFRIRDPRVALGLRKAIRRHGSYAGVARGLASGKLQIVDRTGPYNRYLERVEDLKSRIQDAVTLHAMYTNGQAHYDLAGADRLSLRANAEDQWARVVKLQDQLESVQLMADVEGFGSLLRQAGEVLDHA